MSIKLGKFGEFVKQYEKARRGYPLEVFVFLKKFLPNNQVKILDLGCGTGISTRQLARLGQVIGCDPDLIMLDAARKHKKINKEKYVLGSAEKLPFKAHSFDAVTAFSSFHWFDNTKSLNEIKRVLKPGAIIFLVNKGGWKSWGEGYRRAIIKTLGREIAPFAQSTPKAKLSLRNHKFKNIKSKNWEKIEIIRSVKDALIYVQSISIWKSVPKKLRPKALLGLEKYFKSLKKKTGMIERKFTLRAVVGVNK